MHRAFLLPFLGFLLRYKADCAKINPNDFLGENDEEITLCFISAGFGAHGAATTPCDTNGNPIFEARYRLLKALSTEGDDGSVHLDRKDVRLNTAMHISPGGAWSDYFILNVYANGSKTTVGDHHNGNEYHHDRNKTHDCNHYDCASAPIRP